MATIQEFITAKLTRFNIELSEAELDAALIDQGLTASDEYSSSASRSIKLAIVGMIPELLLAPDVTEGGYAIKWDKAGIKAYYSLLCYELGVEDVLSGSISVTDRSNLW